MNLLFVGDIIGKGGRKAVIELVPELRKTYSCSFCIANAENIAGGSGLSAKCIAELTPNPVDVITTGDHVWDQNGFDEEIKRFQNVLRPATQYCCAPRLGSGAVPSCGV